jgi:hypothetical protein
MYALRKAFVATEQFTEGRRYLPDFSWFMSARFAAILSGGSQAAPREVKTA